MRTISLVENLELEYQGNLCSRAITVGDVDNDKGNELVVGNVSGELFIYKGSNSKPWRKASDLDMTTCVEVGDVCNHGMNYLVTLSSSGWCHIFAVKPDSVVAAAAAAAAASSQAPQDGTDSTEDMRVLKPCHRQQLAANGKVALVADIDGDGFCELVIGYSDRRVRAYSWTETGDTVGGSSGEAGGSAFGTLMGKFVLRENWQLAGQIGSMTVNKRVNGGLDLMVSQPGGTFVTLLCTHSIVSVKAEENDTVEDTMLQDPSLIYHPLGSARARNPGVTTEVIGNISRAKKGAETGVARYSAICTLDGTLTLVDTSGEDDKIIWSLYVDHQLFTLAKLDVTSNGTEEVVACSWDGQTYIINLNKDVVRFQFQENVAAFCAGKYAVEGSENVPCLIYVTFNNSIRVYHSIYMSEIGISNLLKNMEDKEGISELLDTLNCDGRTPSQARQLYHWCLYGFQPNAS